MRRETRAFFAGRRDSRWSWFPFEFFFFLFLVGQGTRFPCVSPLIPFSFGVVVYFILFFFFVLGSYGQRLALKLWAKKEEAQQLGRYYSFIKRHYW
jgi:hypothetical protein